VTRLVLAADYPFLDVLWTLLVFFAWVIWFWLLITILVDVFRRDDLSGWGKVGWTLFVIFLPLLGVLIYLGTQSKHMAERNVRDARAAQTQMDDYVRSVASEGGTAAEIERAKKLLDSGAISQAEFDQIKQKALA
jgi:Short C-terminal domain/Phospholipase_D-nuclease N-terminal